MRISDWSSDVCSSDLQDQIAAKLSEYALLTKSAEASAAAADKAQLLKSIEELGLPSTTMAYLKPFLITSEDRRLQALANLETVMTEHELCRAVTDRKSTRLNSSH